MTKELPILMSTPMVRALLAGVKTQTRRVLRVQPVGTPFAAQMSRNRAMTQPVFAAMWDNRAADGSTCCLCPYGVAGDRLWVREAYRAMAEHNAVKPSELPRSTPILYEASRHPDTLFGKLRPGIHMPRWASRITLEITAVRVERLQDISEADAVAEGCNPTRGLRGDDFIAVGAAVVARERKSGRIEICDARDRYAVLWRSIQVLSSWDSNPWVWVVEFKRLQNGET